MTTTLLLVRCRGVADCRSDPWSDLLHESAAPDGRQPSEAGIAAGAKPQCLPACAPGHPIAGTPDQHLLDVRWHCARSRPAIHGADPPRSLRCRKAPLRNVAQLRRADVPRRSGGDRSRQPALRIRQGAKDPSRTIARRPSSRRLAETMRSGRDSRARAPGGQAPRQKPTSRTTRRCRRYSRRPSLVISGPAFRMCARTSTSTIRTRTSRRIAVDHAYHGAFTPGMPGGTLSAAPAGAIDIEGVRWRVEFPPTNPY